MRYNVEGHEIDTADLLNLNIGPLDGWMGGAMILVGVYANPAGRLYILQESPYSVPGGRPVGRVLTIASPSMVRYLAERFEIPAAYIRAADSEEG